MTRPGYKMTEIGEIPEDWDIESLSDSCSRITDGSHYSPQEVNVGTRLIATVFNMDNNRIITETCRIISNKDYDLLVKNGCKPDKGDVLFSKDGTVGICFPYFQQDNLVLLSSIAILKPSDDVNSTFLSYFLKSEKGMSQIIGLKTGSALKRITLKNLKLVKIPLPLCKEQQKIAEILSSTDEAVQRLNDQISKTERLKKGLMQTLLTKGIGHTKFKMTELEEIPEEWDIVKIGDPKVTEKMKAGGTPLKSVNHYYKYGKIPFVKIEDIVNSSKYLTRTFEFITDEGLNNSSSWLSPIDSVLFSMYASYGEVCINKIPVATNQAIITIIPKRENVDVGFLYYELKNLKNSLRQYLRFTTQNNLNAEIVRGLKIILPPLLEQQKIAEILSDIDSYLGGLKNYKDKLNSIKKGLMQDLLTGKVRVNNLKGVLNINGNTV